MAMTKFRGLFLNRNALATPTEHKYDTNVCTKNMTGITASSASLSAVSCEASLVKTRDRDQLLLLLIEKGDQLRQGVKSITLRFATNFCISASNSPRRAMIYPGRLTQTTSSTASNTSKMRCPRAG
jgi:hypothetical protein